MTYTGVVPVLIIGKEAGDANHLHYDMTSLYSKLPTAPIKEF